MEDEAYVLSLYREYCSNPNCEHVPFDQWRGENAALILATSARKKSAGGGSKAPIMGVYEGTPGMPSASYGIPTAHKTPAAAAPAPMKTTKCPYCHHNEDEKKAEDEDGTLQTEGPFSKIKSLVSSAAGGKSLSGQLIEMVKSLLAFKDREPAKMESDRQAYVADIRRALETELMRKKRLSQQQAGDLIGVWGERWAYLWEAYVVRSRDSYKAVRMEAKISGGKKEFSANDIASAVAAILDATVKGASNINELELASTMLTNMVEIARRTGDDGIQLLAGVFGVAAAAAPSEAGTLPSEMKKTRGRPDNQYEEEQELIEALRAEGVSEDGINIVVGSLGVRSMDDLLVHAGSKYVGADDQGWTTSFSTHFKSRGGTFDDMQKIYKVAIHASKERIMGTDHKKKKDVGDGKKYGHLGRMFGTSLRTHLGNEKARMAATAFKRGAERAMLASAADMDDIVEADEERPTENSELADFVETRASLLGLAADESYIMLMPDASVEPGLKARLEAMTADDASRFVQAHAAPLSSLSTDGSGISHIQTRAGQKYVLVQVDSEPAMIYNADEATGARVEETGAAQVGPALQKNGGRLFFIFFRRSFVKPGEKMAPTAGRQHAQLHYELSRVAHLTTFAKLAHDTGLDKQLASGQGPYTVFAPKNSAFTKELLAKLPKDRSEQLRILQNHVIGGALTRASELNGTKQTLGGKEVTIDAARGTINGVRYRLERRSPVLVVYEIDNVLL